MWIIWIQIIQLLLKLSQSCSFVFKDWILMGIIKQCTYPTHPDPPPRNRTHPHPPTPIQNSFPPTPTTTPEKQNSPPNQNYAPQCQFFKFTGQKAQQFFNYFSIEFFKRVKRVKRVFEFFNYA